jgi:hypothetical protein
MQNVDTSVAGWGFSAELIATPGDVPVSAIDRHVAWPKQPAACCPGQNIPAPSASVLLPVVTGDSDAEMVPTSLLPSLPPGRQSSLSPCEFVVVQASPAAAPRSHVPLPIAPGAPVAEQRGHG